MYRFQPNATVQVFDLYLSTIRRAVDDLGNVDLDRLEWVHAERPFDETSLRLALRHGIATRTGIVVDGTDLVPIDQYKQAVQIDPHRSPLPGGDIMEALFTGWIEDGRKRDARIVANHAALIEEMRGELDDELAAKPKEALVAHWTALGGQLPTNP